MCTAMYPGLARNFAFAVGGETKPGNIGPEQVLAMARDLGFGPRYVMGVAQALIDALLAALEPVQAALRGQAMAGTETTLIDRLGLWIRTNTRKHAKRWGLSA